MEVVVFTNNGQTFLFKGVENFTNTTTGFKFDYFGQMTQVERHAVFNNTSVAGYALKEENQLNSLEEDELEQEYEPNKQVTIDSLNAMIDK